MNRKTDPPTLKFERELWKNGFFRIVGLDEAGRGALAGPVYVGAVILPADVLQLPQRLDGVRDSKQMTSRQREAMVPLIERTALAWGVQAATAEEIDAMGIVQATRLAAWRALGALSFSPDYLLTDFRLELPESELPQTSIVKGDQQSLSIAAASVLAKVYRDKLMREIHAQLPEYGWGQNKGYGTQAHRSAMKRLGLSSFHRKSFILKS